MDAAKTFLLLYAFVVFAERIRLYVFFTIGRIHYRVAIVFSL